MSTTLDARASERARPHPTTAWLLPLLRRLHFYAGILVGPFLVVAAVTGALYVFTPQLERAVYADALTGTVSSQPLTLDRQVETAQRAAGTSESPVNVRPASDGGTTRVMFADPALEAGESRAVFVDPGTGRVTGDMTVYGTSGALPLRTTIDRLHRELLLGEPGRLYSELAATWLWVLALSGLVLVVLHRRRVARGRRARVSLVPRPGEANDYRRTRSWHTATGVWLAVGFLFLSASGLTWSAYAGENVSQLRTVLSWTTPKVATDLGGGSGGSGAAPVDEHAEHHHGHHMPAAAPGSFDAVLATARQEGLEAQTVEIKPAASDGAAWTVSENERSWPTQVDSVAVDPHHLQVTDHVRFSGVEPAGKARAVGRGRAHGAAVRAAQPARAARARRGDCRAGGERLRGVVAPPSHPFRGGAARSAASARCTAGGTRVAVAGPGPRDRGRRRVPAAARDLPAGVPRGAPAARRPGTTPHGGRRARLSGLRVRARPDVA